MTKLNRTAYNVLDAIPPDGSAIKNRELAARAHCHPRTVQRHLSALVDAELLTEHYNTSGTRILTRV